MATQLGIYNDSLDQIGSRRLAALSEDREPTRVLNSVWDDVLAFTLRRAIWAFALRSSTLTGAATTSFGFTYSFTKPSDLIYTYKWSAVSSFGPVLDDAIELGGAYYARQTPLYLLYTSDSASYGENLSIWPATFAQYVSTYLAGKVCYRLTRNLDLAKALKAEAELLLGVARTSEGLLGSVGQLPHDQTARREFTPGDNPAEPWFATVTAAGGGSAESA